MIKKPKVISSTEYKQLVKPEKSKYGNKKVICDGIKFDSIGEKNRYLVLKSMEEQNFISELKLQVPFPIIHNGVKICKYIADFTYIQDNVYKVEDLKGFETPEFKLKKKMVKAFYDIDILLTRIK